MDLILDLLLKITFLNTLPPGRFIKKHRQFVQNRPDKFIKLSQKKIQQSLNEWITNNNYLNLNKTEFGNHAALRIIVNYLS